MSSRTFSLSLLLGTLNLAWTLSGSLARPVVLLGDDTAQSQSTNPPERQSPASSSSQPKANQDPAGTGANQLDAAAHLKRGQELRAKDHSEEAIAEFNEAIRLIPDDAEYYNQRGHAFFDIKDFEKSIADYTQAIRLAPKDPIYLQNRASASQLSGNWNAALADFNAAIELDPKSADRYEARGNAFSANQNYDQAIADYTNAIELKPLNAPSYNLRGIAYFNHKEVDRAIADYTKAMELDPKNVVFVANRADCYYRTGPQQNLDKALADDNHALQLDPKNADRYNDRANTYYDKHELDNALADYSQAIQLDPNKPIYFVHRAKVYEAQEGREKRELAIADLKIALKLYESTLGGKHPDVANCTNLLAGRYYVAGNYAEAGLLYKRSLSIKEKLLGPESPGLVDTIGWLANVYQAQAKYAEAQPLRERCVAIMENAQPPDNRTLAAALHNLASLYQDQEKYAAAIPIYQRVLKIQEETRRADDPGIAATLQNLGGIYDLQGNSVDALPLFERALKIDEKAFGPNRPEVAHSLNRMASVYKSQGDYSRARKLWQRALDIQEKALGPEHPNVAVSLDALAGLSFVTGHYDEALPLYQRALQIKEKTLGFDHPSVRDSLNYLGILYQRQGNYAAALPLYVRSLNIAEKANGSESLDVAQTLNNLAILYADQGDYAKARPICERALKIRETMFGPDHSDVALSLDSMAHLLYLQGYYAEALPLYQRAAEITMRQLQRTSAMQSERQQLANIALSRLYLDTFLSCALLVNDAAPLVYQQMLAWKGAVTQRQRLAHASRKSDDPVEQQLWIDLQAIANQLATASRTAPSAEQREAWLKNLSDLTDRKEQLEADLSKRSAKFREVAQETKLTPDSLSKKLPADTALVDLLQFPREVHMKKADGSVEIRWEHRLAAFIVRNAASQTDSSGKQRPNVAMIDLGLVEPIDQAVQDWRAGYGGNLLNRPPDNQPAQKLRKLVWEPLSKHLDGINTVLISPDGELARFPWAALPGKKSGTYLIEDDIAIALIPVPQMLPDLLDEKQLAQSQSSPTLLLLGDLNYDKAADNLKPSTKQNPPLLATDEHRPAIRGEHAMVFPPLPGTAREIQQIANMYQSCFSNKPLELKQSEATPARFCNEASKYRYLHLATHGFFSPPTVRSALTPEVDDQRQEVVGFNPGLLSGLALSGANRGAHSSSPATSASEDSDDGIITALEVAALDLHGVDLVTLSACETGLGQSTGGEGMIGLQRAFQVAGARACVSSLWCVDDAATQCMMSEFYNRLWDKDHPVGKLEALRQAQLEMLHYYDPRTKKLVDRGRGLELDAEPSNNNGRLSPKYWAAFELSGDWR